MAMHKPTLRGGGCRQTAFIVAGAAVTVVVLLIMILMIARAMFGDVDEAEAPTAAPSVHAQPAGSSNGRGEVSFMNNLNN